jgi:hypothetical protein
MSDSESSQGFVVDNDSDSDAFIELVKAPKPKKAEKAAPVKRPAASSNKPAKVRDTHRTGLTAIRQQSKSLQPRRHP